MLVGGSPCLRSASGHETRNQVLSYAPLERIDSLGARRALQMAPKDVVIWPATEVAAYQLPSPPARAGADHRQSAKAGYGPNPPALFPEEEGGDHAPLPSRFRGGKGSGDGRGLNLAAGTAAPPRPTLPGTPSASPAPPWPRRACCRCGRQTTQNAGRFDIQAPPAPHRSGPPACSAWRRPARRCR